MDDTQTIGLPGMPETEKRGGGSSPASCSALRRPMTACELEAVKCLGQVRYPPASWDKRFARSMSGMTTITDKEAPQVWRLLKRYRRQISSPHKANLLMMADELAAPDFRKQPALQRERDRYAQAMQNQLL